MSNLMQYAIKDITDLHVLIEQVFTGQNAEHSLADLLACFSENFKMVTIRGQLIQLTEVSQLFSNNIGKNPSLKIQILNVTPLFESENYCWIQYQELQQTELTETLRTSTACIQVIDQQCYWIYLHETPVIQTA